ncbi:MAG: helix-turn-helix transcriptional regulator [Alphaproteobacteria bacterium]|nr:helix-turn-helix transcriptional regulator [Alphaproteobacteria bacterium]MBT5860965.1 helix-turn-helix transcriptional regulator [Alphaproteobacteria bacterium]
MAGLDATTFNSSKRVTADGKRRWPSTESISKVLAVTGTNLTEFISYTGEPGSTPGQCRLPIIRSGQIPGDEFFDGDGNPTGQQWDAAIVLDVSRKNLFALEVGDQSMMPVFRRGSIVVASPSESVKRGDRVIVRTTAGKMLVRELIRQSAKKIEVRELGHQQTESEIPMDQVSWITRIMWAGQ